MFGTVGGMGGQQGQQSQQQQQRNDVFVGNLDYTTTEEQLHSMFSEIGKVIKVRLVTDATTGKFRGFSFVEFETPHDALAAIRNMNGRELNGRTIRVNFSNNSHLESLAKQLGMDQVQDQPQRTASQPQSVAQQQLQQQQAAGPGTMKVADALKSMSKAEMYDIVSEFKDRVEKDTDDARRLLASHPQLPEAILFLMSKLDMIKTDVQTQDSTVPGLSSVPGATAGAAAIPPSVRAADPRARSDPRAAAATSAGIPNDPRAAGAPSLPRPAVPVAPRADPRARMDPRAARATANAAPPPLPMAQQQQQPPPRPPPSYGGGAAAPLPPNVGSLDPNMVHQVMQLTEEQIQSLPPDKQFGIRQLRNQIQSQQQQQQLQRPY